MAGRCLINNIRRIAASSQKYHDIPESSVMKGLSFLLVSIVFKVIIYIPRNLHKRRSFSIDGNVVLRQKLNLTFEERNLLCFPFILRC